MIIGAPRVVFGLLVLVPVVLLQLRAFLRGRSEIVKLAVQWPAQDVVRLYVVKWFFSALAFDLFVVLSILAAADISWGERPVEEDRAGLDLVVAVDVSRSMLARDVDPSRLARGIAVVRAVSRQMPAARMALVAFKGDAITLMPMTEDSNALEIVLDGVGPALISAPGTDVGAGLAEALRSFPTGSFAHRAIVVLTDGEVLSGDAEEPLAEMRRRGIPALTVVAGTPEGAPVPGPEETTLLDEDGRPVVSRPDAAFLADIADRTGGALLWLDDADIVARLTRELSSFVGTREREGFRLVPRRRYRLFLGAALISLVISTLVKVVRWRGMF